LKQNYFFDLKIKFKKLNKLVEAGGLNPRAVKILKTILQTYPDLVFRNLSLKPGQMLKFLVRIYTFISSDKKMKELAEVTPGHDLASINQPDGL